jgi:hypothetical protein
MFYFVVGITWWQFKFQYQSVQLVEYNDEGNMLSYALAYESVNIESHPFNAVNNDHCAITKSKSCGNLVRETGVTWSVHKVKHVALLPTILH